jgi:hypothetical protein
MAQLCKGAVAATALAWAPSTDAAGGGVETIAAALGTEVAVFRMEAYGGGSGGGCTS